MCVVAADAPIVDVKAMIRKVTGIAPLQQRLLFSEGSWQLVALPLEDALFETYGERPTPQSLDEPCQWWMDTTEDFPDGQVHRSVERVFFDGKPEVSCVRVLVADIEERIRHVDLHGDNLLIREFVNLLRAELAYLEASD